MFLKQVIYIIQISSIVIIGSTIFFYSVFSAVYAQTIETSTTTLEVSICGDAIVNLGEVCDFGVASNTGGYSPTIAGRTCESSCFSYGPYCGDTIIQFLSGETCDDGNNTSDDFCNSVCVVEELTQGGGSSSGGGGGGFLSGSFIPAPDAQVTIQGKAYPNADVNILQDGEVIGVVKADSAADFFFTTTSVTPGTVTFGFWAEDQKGLRSVAFNTTFQVAQAAVTTVSGVFLPPTIELNKRVLDQGETLILSGQTVPEVTVTTVVQSDPVELDIPSDVEGAWSLAFDTSELEEDVHTAKAKFGVLVNGNLAESGYSQSLTFFIGDAEDFVGTPDLNRDGFVNLIDFSILLFHWNTDGGTSDPPADINQDGIVNLTDFSIMIFVWTG